MGWLDSALECLKREYKGRPFLVEEATKTLNKDSGYSRNTVYHVLHQLQRRGSLKRIGSGVYQLTTHNDYADLKASATIGGRVPVEIDSNILKKAMDILIENGIEFMVTGPSSLTRFHHYLSWRYIHIIYVIKGAGEHSVKSLRDADLLALLNPVIKEIETILESLEEKDLFIIREFADLKGNMNGKASIERALVDTYFEVTRDRIPFSEVEVGRIIQNAFREEDIDVPRLLHLASRRGIKEEFALIVKAIMPKYPLRTELSSVNVLQVLKGIEG